MPSVPLRLHQHVDPASRLAKRDEETVKEGNIYEIRELKNRRRKKIEVRDRLKVESNRTTRTNRKICQFTKIQSVK